MYNFNTNCKYYNSDANLFCAVNPTNKNCHNCLDYDSDLTDEIRDNIKLIKKFMLYIKESHNYSARLWLSALFSSSLLYLINTKFKELRPFFIINYVYDESEVKDYDILQISFSFSKEDIECNVQVNIMAKLIKSEKLLKFVANPLTKRIQKYHDIPWHEPYLTEEELIEQYKKMSEYVDLYSVLTEYIDSERVAGKKIVTFLLTIEKFSFREQKELFKMYDEY
jgi:hypothetical protein